MQERPPSGQFNMSTQSTNAHWPDTHDGIIHVNERSDTHTDMLQS